MTTVTLDTLGRLRSFYAVPPEKEFGPFVNPIGRRCSSKADWTRRSFNQFRQSGRRRIETTERAAWDGSYPDAPDFKIHIEAAAFEGKPVYFEIFDAWDQPRENRFHWHVFVNAS